MERGHEKKPAKPKQVRANEFLMGLERGTQLLVMQHQRHLHGTENNNEPTHDEAGVIENIGRFPKESREQRRPDYQRAHDGDDARPFQNVAEPAHREAKQLALAETQAFDPGQTNRDEIDLYVNA